MKIIKLTAENVKRIKAVEIVPGESVQVITGRNAQGKSSVLDAIWLALGGGAAGRETTRPIRDGEDEARVELDMGDLVVTRTWKGDKTALTVTSADGAKYSGPQGILDALVGRLSFDPLAFTRLSAREQVEALTAVVDLGGVDLDLVAAQRKAAFDQRTEIGRDLKSLGEIAKVDPELPESEQSAANLIARMRQAEETRSVQSIEVAHANQLADSCAQLQMDLAKAKDAYMAARSLVENHVPIADVDSLTAELESVEQTNAAVRENNARRERAASAFALQHDYDMHTHKIEKFDEVRANVLASAKFPVLGLGFTDEGVTYNGVPFSQASSAEQIRVSLAMAMSLNPKLRVIRILDGSLLDADNMALIAEMAAKQDYQVWVERVSDDTASAVVIEDGAVV